MIKKGAKVKKQDEESEILGKGKRRERGCARVLNER